MAFAVNDLKQFYTEYECEREHAHVRECHFFLLGIKDISVSEGNVQHSFELFEPVPEI